MKKKEMNLKVKKMKKKIAKKMIMIMTMNGLVFQIFIKKALKKII